MVRYHPSSFAPAFPPPAPDFDFSSMDAIANKHDSLAHHALLPSAKPNKSRCRGYLELTRLHKPVLGNSLMFWPCGKSPSPTHHFSHSPNVLAWGLTMAAYAVGTPLRDLGIQLLLFGIGSTLLHSAACVLNDICDIDLDRLVGRSEASTHRARRR